jgi:hypothetical protein
MPPIKFTPGLPLGAFFRMSGANSCANGQNDCFSTFRFCLCPEPVLADCHVFRSETFVSKRKKTERVFFLPAFRATTLPRPTRCSSVRTCPWLGSVANSSEGRRPSSPASSGEENANTKRFLVEFLHRFFYRPKTPMICQDRLGTHQHPIEYHPDVKLHYSKRRKIKRTFSFAAQGSPRS